MKDLLVQIPQRQREPLWAWVVCIGSFFLQFSFGFHNSFGTFFVALLDKYGRSESETAWVGSMAIGLTYLLGPLSTYLCRHFGCRIVACTGSLIVIVSAFLTSIVDNMMWMYLTFGVLNGLGSSMLYFSSLVVLIEYFHKHLSLANGIAVSGSGIGTLVINLMSQNLISNYGLSITYKAMAGVYGFGFLAGLTFAPTTKGGPKDIPQFDYKGIETEESQTLLSRCRAYFKIGEQWKNKGFIVWTIATGVVLFAYFIPSVYLVSCVLLIVAWLLWRLNKRTGKRGWDMYIVLIF